MRLCLGSCVVRLDARGNGGCPQVRTKYADGNPFHNYYHGVSVMHAVFMFLTVTVSVTQIGVVWAVLTSVSLCVYLRPGCCAANYPERGP